MRILLVEPEPRNTKLIRRALKASAYAVDCCKDTDDALYRLEINDYDLIVLEIQLPNKDGVDLCEEIRSSGITSPILILTAKGSVDDRIRGLDAGADDYLVKPFEVGELLARIRALLRRPRSGMHSPRLLIGELAIDTKSRKAMAGEKEIVLTNKEYALLEYFARNSERVIGREEISEHVWDENFDPFSNLIEVYINRLRRKLRENISSPVLKTRRGSGYVLETTAESMIK
ncbi:MAG: response regulator transcription factor [Acidobacteriota bacterium]|nr:response regulator transcription factor [Acidobacteriota bacterium]